MIHIQQVVKQVNHCQILLVRILNITKKNISYSIGYFTGNCNESRENESITVCEMSGWCPEELSNSM
jgi:hypothetical protein